MAEDWETFQSFVFFKLWRGRMSLRLTWYPNKSYPDQGIYLEEVDGVKNYEIEENGDVTGHWWSVEEAESVMDEDVEIIGGPAENTELADHPDMDRPPGTSGSWGEA